VDNTLTEPITTLENVPPIEVGGRVELIVDEEKWNSFVAAAGSVGTIAKVHLEPGQQEVSVLMDKYIPGCEEWGNHVIMTADEAALSDMRFDQYFWSVFRLLPAADQPGPVN
jgi:hypothetical protein